MKYLSLAGLLIVLFLTTPAFSQDDKEVKVKIITEEDGKKKVFEKTYQSKEEMQNDPEFRELADTEEIDIDSDVEHMTFVTKSEEDTEDVTIEVESEGETVKVKKVTKGADGKEKVVEKTYESLEALEADEDFNVKIQELDDADGFEWESDGKGDTKIIIKKKRDHEKIHEEDHDHEVDHEHDVEVIIEEDGKKVKKKVKKRVEIEIEEKKER